jgi:hypothetical protein
LDVVLDEEKNVSDPALDQEDLLQLRHHLSGDYYD